MEDSGKSLTIRILIGMAIGLFIGLLINLTGYVEALKPLNGALIQYGAEGFFHFLGQAFLSLLRVLVVPLVFISLVCGTTALEDVRKLGRIGLRTMGLYLLTTAIAISTALAAGLIIRPGDDLGLKTEASFVAREAPSLVETFLNIFPRNIFSSFVEGNMLQIIVFSILLGVAINLSGEAGKRLKNLFEDLNEVVMNLVWIIMKIAPYGVFGLIAKTFATQGFDAILPLLKYFFLVLSVLLIHALVTYPTLLRTIARLPAGPFLRKLREVQVFAFSTASSNATIPVTLRSAENRLGAHPSVASFSVPLGATINMDGTAIMQGVATVFIAQAYGMSLELTDYLMVIVTATLASIGTAGVPGVGLIMLSMVLLQVGLPVEGIGLIIGIDRLLDMVRTAVNVTGDCAVTCIVAKKENALDETVYQNLDTK